MTAPTLLGVEVAHAESGNPSVANPGAVEGCLLWAVVFVTDAPGYYVPPDPDWTFLPNEQSVWTRGYKAAWFKFADAGDVAASDFTWTNGPFSGIDLNPWLVQIRAWDITGWTLDTTGLIFGAAIPPPNDDFADRIVITGTSGYSDRITIDAATNEGGEPAPLSGDGAKTVWFEYVGPGPGTIANVRFDTQPSRNTDTGTALDTEISVYTGLPSFGSLTLIADNDDGYNPPTSSVVFDADEGTSYYIQVSAYSGSLNGNIVLRWQVVDPDGLPKPLATHGPLNADASTADGEQDESMSLAILDGHSGDPPSIGKAILSIHVALAETFVTPSAAGAVTPVMDSEGGTESPEADVVDDSITFTPFLEDGLLTDVLRVGTYWDESLDGDSGDYSQQWTADDPGGTTSFANPLTLGRWVMAFDAVGESVQTWELLSATAFDVDPRLWASKVPVVDGSPRTIGTEVLDEDPAGLSLSQHRHTGEVRHKWFYRGDLAVLAEADSDNLDIDAPMTLRKLRGRVKDAPTGDDILISIYKNSVLVQQFTITDGTDRVADDALAVAYADGDYVSTSIDQVGSTTPGANLSLLLVFEEE